MTGRTSRHRAVGSAAVLVGTGGALIVALDGSWVWRFVRLALVVLAATSLDVAARSWSTRFAPLWTAAVGTVALTVGATIGFAYLSNGLSPRSVGGVVTAVGGIVAVAAAGSALLRRTRGRWRVLAVPVVILVGYVVVRPLAVAVFATNVPRPAIGPASPAERGLRYEDARFVTPDGVTLSGWYVPSTNRAALVLLHGASSTRADVLDQAVVLARHGYGVLLIDARGHGRSGGRAMELGWNGDEDIAGAVTWLEGRADVDRARIGAVGMSMGGEEAVGAMAADPRLRATVAEGATNRVSGDTAWLSDAYGLRGALQEGVSWLTYRLADLLSSARPPGTLRAAVAMAAPRPVLLITAGRVADEQAAARFIRQASPGTVEVWSVPGAAHTGGLRSRPAEWERRVTAFLDGALLRS